VLCGKQKKFCSTQCKAKYGNNKHQNYNAQQRRGRQRRNALIDHAGGACSVCGYNKNKAALCFHHIDGSTKSFSLCLRNCSNRKESALYAELQKCILLCSNCHMELHYPDENA
jgi:predicted HNH restriction endonuclease